MSQDNKKLFIIIVAALVVLALACVGAGMFALGTWRDTGSSLTTAAPEEFAFPLATDEDGIAAKGGDTEGGTLRVAGSLPPTLDPAMVQDSTSSLYVVHLFSGLVVLDRNLEVTPDIAQSWELSADGTTYTFHLDPEATFQDGRAITAEDFVYSLERALAPETGSPVAPSYLGDIIGAEAYAAGEVDQLEGVRIIDDETLEIRIDAPKAYFLAKLTYPSALLVDREQIEREGDQWISQPNGSGPFALESISPDEIVLVRNERYYGRKPAVARVEFTLSGGVPITMYENGLLDLVDVGPSDIDRVLDPANPLFAETQVSPELSVSYLAFNVQQPPFDDPAVRQAFAHAIDKAKIADLVLRGTAVAANTILPPGMPGYDATQAGQEYDPELARTLLAASRYAKSGAMPEVVLAVSGTSGYLDSISEAVIAMIQENLGIAITVEQVEWSDFLQDMNRQAYGMYSSGWIADYPDPQNFLDLLFHSASSQNHSGYANAAVDALLEQARVESDESARMALYRQAEALILADAPWIPLTHGVTYTLVQPYVEGFSSGASLYPWIRDVTLTP